MHFGGAHYTPTISFLYCEYFTALFFHVILLHITVCWMQKVDLMNTESNQVSQQQTHKLSHEHLSSVRWFISPSGHIHTVDPNAEDEIMCWNIWSLTTAVHTCFSCPLSGSTYKLHIRLQHNNESSVYSLFHADSFSHICMVEKYIWSKVWYIQNWIPCDPSSYFGICH